MAVGDPGRTPPRVLAANIGREYWPRILAENKGRARRAPDQVTVLETETRLPWPAPTLLRLRDRRRTRRLQFVEHATAPLGLWLDRTSG